MDMWTELYQQEQNSDQANIARARVAAISIARQEIVPFVKVASSQAERDIRLSIAEPRLREIVAFNAEQFHVSPGIVFDGVYTKITAEIAVTDPKRESIDSPIGGAEGSKYDNTKARIKGEDAPDGTTESGGWRSMPPGPEDKDGSTDTGYLEPVVLEPVRHKYVQDVKLESQKDNAPDNPYSNEPSQKSKAKGKSPVASVKEAGGLENSPAARVPLIKHLIEHLQKNYDPDDPVASHDVVGNLHDDYAATPEDYEGNEDWANADADQLDTRSADRVDYGDSTRPGEYGKIR